MRKNRESASKLGSFIISLDCEGKWGMADCLDKRLDTTLTDRALVEAYERLCEIFGETSFPATFAFVAVFLMDAKRAAKFLDGCEHADSDAMQSWLSAYRAQQADGRREGWHLPQLLELISAKGSHEIAAHGFSHLPLGRPDITDGIARSEINAARKAFDELGTDPKTYIFARNELKATAAVREAGFIAYRDGRSSSGQLGRAATLLSEVLASDASAGETPHLDDEMVGDHALRIDPGRFLNFRIGLRRFVPRQSTVRRWKAVLNNAANSGGVAHLWFHPHNLISDPGCEDTLREILDHAANLRDEGKLRFETQESYAHRVLHQVGDASNRGLATKSADHRNTVIQN